VWEIRLHWSSFPCWLRRRAHAENVRTRARFLGRDDRQTGIDPGFRTDLSMEEAVAQVKRIGAALIGQSPRLVPADKKLYALRDVTATIDSIPLIAAVLCRKSWPAEPMPSSRRQGWARLVYEDHRSRAHLAHAMVEIGTEAGVRTVAALTAMDEPLGWSVGNALEVAEACGTLTGKGRIDARFRKLAWRWRSWIGSRGARDR